jgi:hypothetical protein
MLKSKKLVCIKSIICFVIFLSGLFLLAINLYGLGKDVRPDMTNDEHLRFENDVELTYLESLGLLTRKEGENEARFTDRITYVISKSLAHIEWEQFDPQKYNQLIPIWENYFLYFMGVYSGIPEYERYHYANYKKSLYRGIGICGDASMIMSEVLNENNINNKIITFPGHVIVLAKIDGKEKMYDPDFGVILPYSREQINVKPNLIAKFYRDKGYSDKEINNLISKYAQKYKVWDGVSHFITNKYYFEKFAYVMKWPLPILLIIISSFYLRRNMN